jgi:ribose transport system permease protein
VTRRREVGLIVVLLGFGLLLWAVAPRVDGRSTFLAAGNLKDVARACSFIGTAAVGATLVMVGGGIDLSVGSLRGLSVVATAQVMAGGGGIAAGVAVGLLAGLGGGLVNGALVGYARLPPFIATLGTLSMARGLAYLLTGGRVISGLPASFEAFGRGYWLGVVPWPVVVLVLCAAAGWVLMERMAFGRAVHALGGNPEAAVLSGLPVKRITLAVYALAGLFAGIAGVTYAARFGYGSSTAGLGYELSVISAVVIGGTSLAGGDGTVLGSVLGAVLMGLLANGLTLLNVSEEYTQLAIGGVIVAAVWLDRVRRSRLA